MTNRARFGSSPRASNSRKTSGRAPSIRTKTARIRLAGISGPSGAGGWGSLPTQAQGFAKDDGRDDRGGKGDHDQRRPDRMTRSWYPQGSLERGGVGPAAFGRRVQGLTQHAPQSPRDAGPVGRLGLGPWRP